MCSFLWVIWLVVDKMLSFWKFLEKGKHLGKKIKKFKQKDGYF